MQQFYKEGSVVFVHDCKTAGNAFRPLACDLPVYNVPTPLDEDVVLPHGQLNFVGCAAVFVEHGAGSLGFLGLFVLCAPQFDLCNDELVDALLTRRLLFDVAAPHAAVVLAALGFLHDRNGCVLSVNYSDPCHRDTGHSCADQRCKNDSHEKLFTLHDKLQFPRPAPTGQIDHCRQRWEAQCSVSSTP